MLINDLRIGNLVQFDSGISEVIGIDSYKVKLIDGDWWDIEGVIPIELNKEWLEKFNFKEHKFA